MSKKVAASVFMETDYTVFKHLLGNRAVTPARKTTIRNSIEKVGYVLNPIVVNKNMEVIDGQGRLAVLEELGLPVFYVVDENAGIDECVSMNIGQTNWKLIDYVEQYAAYGNINYIRFLDLYKSYSKRITIDTITGVTSNSIVTNGWHNNKLKTGEFLLSEKAYNSSLPYFEYLLSIKDALDEIPGSERVKSTGIAWILRNTKCDKKRLKMIIQKNYPKINPVVDTAPCLFLGQISDIYNKGIASEKCIYFDTEYKIFLKKTGGKNNG